MTTTRCHNDQRVSSSVRSNAAIIAVGILFVLCMADLIPAVTAKLEEDDCEEMYRCGKKERWETATFRRCVNKLAKNDDISDEAARKWKRIKRRKCDEDDLTIKDYRICIAGFVRHECEDSCDDVDWEKWPKYKKGRFWFAPFHP